MLEGAQFKHSTWPRLARYKSFKNVYVLILVAFALISISFTLRTVSNGLQQHQEINAPKEKGKAICQGHTSRGRFDRTLVIVMFNHAKHIEKNFPRFQSLHGAEFPNIKYCSDTDFPNDPNAIHAPLYNGYNNIKLEYLNGYTDKNPLGSLTYQCTLVAMKRFPGQFDGYLSVADDVLLSIGRLSKLPLTDMWAEPRTARFSTSDMKATGGKFALWSRLEPGGAKSALKAEQNNALDSRFRDALTKNGWFHASCDMYYFPSSATNVFQHLAPIFLDAQVYFSNAVATMMHLIKDDKSTKPDNIALLHGSSKWYYDNDRTEWQKHLPQLIGEADYYHPLKLSGIQFNNPSQVEVLCAFIASKSNQLNAQT